MLENASQAGKIKVIQKLLSKGEIMDSKLNRCAFGAWHYGENLCKVCKVAKG